MANLPGWLDETELIDSLLSFERLMVGQTAQARVLQADDQPGCDEPPPWVDCVDHLGRCRLLEIWRFQVSALESPALVAGLWSSFVSLTDPFADVLAGCVSGHAVPADRRGCRIV